MDEKIRAAGAGVVTALTAKTSRHKRKVTNVTSRDPNKLHAALRLRWEWMRDEWQRRYPDAPQPFLTCTYRSPDEQTRLVNEGKSRALPGQSLHNYEPAYAFDVAFRVGSGLTWEFHWFEKWGELAESIGLEWGGRWKHLVDGPHVQMPMTWQDAKAGKVPSLPHLPTELKRVTRVIIKGDFDVIRDDGDLIVIAK